MDAAPKNAKVIAGMFWSPSISDPASASPLGPGIVALALLSAIALAATLILVATTALHATWSDSCFQWMAATMVAALAFAQTRNLSPARIAFASGVMLAALPSLVIAARQSANHWDDFSAWLANALYIWRYGAFPTADALPLASALPGYPPGSSIVLAVAWSGAGEAVESAGPVINVACLMILPALVLRILRVGPPRGLLAAAALGAALTIPATVLNLGVDWHWVLSSLPDTVTAVAFAVAFVLAAESLVLREVSSKSHLTALAAILGLVTNLKQTGIVLVSLLALAFAVVAVLWMGWREVRPRLLKLLLVCLPSLIVWWCWHLYLTNIFPAYSPSIRPINDWYYWLLPDFLASLGRNMAEHWLFYAPVLTVVGRGLYVLGRRWLTGTAAPASPGDRLAAGFALIQAGYSTFLIICYIGAFDERDIRAAAEWFRYQAHIGDAGLLVAVVLAMERWRAVFEVGGWRRRALSLSNPICRGGSTAAVPGNVPARQIAIGAATVALLLAGSAALVRGAGIYHSKGTIDPIEIQQLRRIGQNAGQSIVAAGKHTTAELITYDHMLPVLIVRYEIWAQSWNLIDAFHIDPAEDAGPDMARRFNDAERSGAFAVALKYDGRAHCAVWDDRGEDSRFSGIDAAACRLSISAALSQQR